MGQNGPRGRLAPPCSTNMICKRNKAVMYLEHTQSFKYIIINYLMMQIPKMMNVFSDECNDNAENSTVIFLYNYYNK